jgi:quercetin dioxygenase-like cupin family protein
MTPQTLDSLVHSPGETVREDPQQTAQRPAATGTREAAPAPWRNEVQYVPAGTGPAYWGPGNQLTFLITGKETGGAFFLAEMSVPPGGGPPPHIHRREDESFHLLEGTLTVQVGGNTITASAGDFVYLPRGIVHSFKNTGDGTAKALVLTTPAGLENYFAEVFDPAGDRSATPPPPSKEMLARAMATAPRYGLELLPPA